MRPLLRRDRTDHLGVVVHSALPAAELPDAPPGGVRDGSPEVAWPSRPPDIRSRCPRSRFTGQGVTGAGAAAGGATAAGTTSIGTDDEADVSHPLPFAVRTSTR